MSTKNMAKRTAAGTLALAVCLGGGALAAAGAANADSSFKFDRIAAGTDRFDTAILASQTAFPSAGQAGGVVLVNGWRSVDGLTASSLAGAYGASVLYTEKDEVPAKTRAEIDRLGTKNIWLVGGDAVLSTKLEADLKSAGFTIKRVAGADRYSTATEVSDAVIAKKGKPAHVFVASGIDGNLSDSTTVASIAYSTGYPILLSEPSDAPKATTDQLDDVKGADIHIVGGTKALTDAVYNEVGAKGRFAGSDRGQTANYVADWAKANVAGWSKANAALVGSANSAVADTLSSVALLGNQKTSVHYAGLETTNTYLKDHSAELTGKGWVIGGKAVVSDDAVAAATTASQTPMANQTITVTGSATSADSATYSSSDAGTYLSYSAAVPAGVDSVSIKLVPASDVKSSSAGILFTKADNYLRADFTDDDSEIGQAKIVKYNGTSVAYGSASTTVDAVPVVDGKVTFRVTVNSENAAGSFVPVVFAGTEVSGTTYLPVDANGKPTGKFGVATKSAFNPGQAPAGSPTAVVTAVGNGSFTASYGGGANAGVFTYKADDTFQKGGASWTSDAFIAALSVGDTVGVTSYLPVGAAGTRGITWNLTTDKVAAPTSASVALSDANLDGTNDTAKLTFTAAATGLQTSSAVRYKRATVVDGVVGEWGSPVTATVIYSGKTGTVTLPSIPDPGTYVYKVSTLGLVGSAWSTYSDQSATLTVGTASLATLASAPVSKTIALTEGGTADNLINSGDTVLATFNEPIAVPTVDASITLTDTDGTPTVGSLTNGVNATFSRVGAANNQLKIVLTSAPSITTAGSTAGIAAGADITAASGVKDLNATAQSWNVLDGELTTPGSTVAIRRVTSANATTGLVQTSSTFTTFTEADVPATTQLIPGATITLAIVGGTGSGTSYTATIAADGTFSVAAGAVANTSQIEISQTVTNAGTSAVTSRTMTS